VTSTAGEKKETFLFTAVIPIEGAAPAEDLKAGDTVVPGADHFVTSRIRVDST